MQAYIVIITLYGRRKFTQYKSCSYPAGYISTNSYTDTGLNTGTLYHYKVYLSNNGATFVVANAIGAFVVPLTATYTTLNDTTISLNIVSDGKKFDIQRKGPEVYDLTGAEDLTVKQYDDTGLTYETEYQYQVRAKLDVSFIVPAISDTLNWTDIPNKIATNYTIESSTMILLQLYYRSCSSTLYIIFHPR